MKTMVNLTTGHKEEVPTGFSFTGLLFGVFVPLFRGDFVTVIVCLAVCIVTAGFGVLVIWPFLAFCYNGYYIRRMEEKGWVTEQRYKDLKTAGMAV